MLIKTEVLESICYEILALDDKIRFAIVLDGKGKSFVEVMRDGVKPFLESKAREMLLMETALYTRMDEGHDTHLGTVKFNISYDEKIVSMDFPLDRGMLCIYAEKGDVDVLNLAFLILHLLETKYTQSKPECEMP